MVGSANAVDYDNGTCQYPTPPLAETNLPILQITGTDVKIYKRELDEQVTISPEFLIHVNELTLIVQSAGENGKVTIPTTTFKPLKPFQEIKKSKHNYYLS